jgi:large subunit ribosomal protein L22
MQATAKMNYVRLSPQKARLVVDTIRGRRVDDALAILAASNKRVAPQVAKVLRSAIANAQQKDGFSGDVDRLFVSACYANQGPSQKRVRPAPMGRAFRVLKRTAHLTVQVAERPEKVVPVAAKTGDGEAKGGAKRPRGRQSKGGGRQAKATKKAK